MDNMDSVGQWFHRDGAERLLTALQKREYRALYVKTAAQVKDILLQEISKEDTVGVAGSVTIRELGVLDNLRRRGNKLFDHWVAENQTSADSIEIRRSQQTCDVFLSSTNAITMDGRLVNTDGIGNRVNAMAFGPKKVIVVAGCNKIVPNVNRALQRIKEIAVPLNCKRLGLGPPCMQVGQCIDCRVPQRVCRITTIIEWKPPLIEDFLIIVVGETLGY